MKSEDSEDYVHRDNFRSILEDFRRSLKEEFGDSVTNSEEQSTFNNKDNESKMTNKDENVRKCNENTTSLIKRRGFNHSQSVLHDLRITRESITMLNDHQCEDKSLEYQYITKANEDHEESAIQEIARQNITKLKEAREHSDITKVIHDQSDITKKSHEKSAITKEEAHEQNAIRKESNEHSDITKGIHDQSDITKKSHEKSAITKEEAHEQNAIRKESNEHSDITKGIHEQSDITKGIHEHSDITKGMHEQSDITKGMHEQSDITKGIHEQSDITKDEAHEQSAITKETQEQRCSTKEVHDQSDETTDVNEQSDNTNEAHKQSGSPKEAYVQSGSTKDAQEPNGSTKDAHEQSVITTNAHEQSHFTTEEAHEHIAITKKANEFSAIAKKANEVNDNTNEPRKESDIETETNEQSEITKEAQEESDIKQTTKSLNLNSDVTDFHNKILETNKSNKTEESFNKIAVPNIRTLQVSFPQAHSHDACEESSKSSNNEEKHATTVNSTINDNDHNKCLNSKHLKRTDCDTNNTNTNNGIKPTDNIQSSERNMTENVIYKPRHDSQNHKCTDSEIKDPPVITKMIPVFSDNNSLDVITESDKRVNIVESYRTEVSNLNIEHKSQDVLSVVQLSNREVDGVTGIQQSDIRIQNVEPLYSETVDTSVVPYQSCSSLVDNTKLCEESKDENSQSKYDNISSTKAQLSSTNDNISSTNAHLSSARDNISLPNAQLSSINIQCINHLEKSGLKACETHQQKFGDCDMRIPDTFSGIDNQRFTTKHQRNGEITPSTEVLYDDTKQLHSKEIEENMSPPVCSATNHLQFDTQGYQDTVDVLFITPCVVNSTTFDILDLQQENYNTKLQDMITHTSYVIYPELNVSVTENNVLGNRCESGILQNNNAQAQARAEQRKNSDIHMKFDSDGLHIQTDNTHDNSSSAQKHITQPQQQMLMPASRQLTLLTEIKYDSYDGGGALTDMKEAVANPYLSSYITNVPEFSKNAVTTDIHGYPLHGSVIGGNSSGSNINNPHGINDNVGYNSPGMNSDLHSDSSHPDQVNRRRRLGRDHSNYVLPTNIGNFKDKKGKYENQNGSIIQNAGPPGLPLSANEMNYGEDVGLKLVVLDKTDDEDENRNTDDYHGDESSKIYQANYTPRSNSDVFPIDKNAVDRDLYKQMYDPAAETVSSNRRPSLQTLSVLPNVAATFGTKGNNDTSSRLTQYTDQHDTTSKSGFVFNVTDYDSETNTNTGKTSSFSNKKLNSIQQFYHFDGSSLNKVIVSDDDHHRYGHPPLEQPRSVSISSTSQQVYSISQIDYDRFTSNASQLSTVREEMMDRLIPDKPVVPLKFYQNQQDINNRTFLIDPPTANLNHLNKIKHKADAKVHGPGYKFQVNKYNVAKRASILNRAEQLLDSRRGQFTDRSESSDELERIDEDDDEDSDLVDDMSGPRHRSLKHLQRRIYEDSTSYNSSDDVLNNLRYHPRGPVTQAARRARLTSVNARLKSINELGYQEDRFIRPPPSLTSDPDESSSESEFSDIPLSYRQSNDQSRYEDPKLLEVNNDSSRESQLHQVEAASIAKGRRVLFFRNGDSHYKPKQVLINNKTYTNLEKLLVDLSSMVETSTGVKYIFAWPEGHEIKSITEFENGRCYVCSSTNKLQRVDYGSSKESHWKGGKIDRNDNFLFQKADKLPSPLRRPRVLTVISNLFRDSREKLILNTNSQMNFEDILNDISNMINIPNPPVRALYTEKKPHEKVESYSQLIRDFAEHTNFIACGEELVPLELSSRRKGQSSDGSVQSRKTAFNKNNGYEASRFQKNSSLPSTRSPDGAYSTVAHSDQVKSRRRKTDSFRVDINGKVREFFPPTQVDQNDDGLKPVKKLKLDWVYGYRGRDVKQNLAVISTTGELVYFVAAVVVVYNKKVATQRHYLGHSEEITCLAVHPNGRFIATGQISGSKPETGAHVRIWDSKSLSTYAVVGLGTFQQGVACVNFSERNLNIIGEAESIPGDLLMVIEDSDRHVLTVWEWQTETLIARTSTTSDPVVSGCFYPFDESIIVTYGKEHIHFWRMFFDKDRKIMRDKLSGNFEDRIPKFVTSVCFSTNGDVISGDSSGAILVWTRDSNSVFSVNGKISAQTRKAHKKSVSALCMLGDGTLLSGGGNVVKAWDSINNYTLVKERVLPESAGHVRTILPMNMKGLDGSIYVATTKNTVLEGSLQLKFKFIIQGHVEELWAVECHPLEDTFISAGHDQTVVKWSTVSHTAVWRVNVENPCTSISIDPFGRLIALGTTAGKVVILNSASGVQMTLLMSGTIQINALSFSPDGKQLAVGTFDGLIQIFYVQDDGHNFFKPQTSALKYNTMFIMHMDWSQDCKLIQAVMGDYELVYWNVTTMQRIKSSRGLRDVKWATQNCPIGHSVIGPWQNVGHEDVINVVSRSHNTDMQLIGDTKGRLRLYKWPCSASKASYHQTKVYSSNVTCASFTCGDNYLIASGGNDAALMQFSILDTVNTR